MFGTFSDRFTSPSSRKRVASMDSSWRSGKVLRRSNVRLDKVDSGVASVGVRAQTFLDLGLKINWNSARDYFIVCQRVRSATGGSVGGDVI